MKNFLRTLTIILTIFFCTSVNAEFVSDLIVTSPAGIWTDERAYGSISDAISAIGSNEQTLVIGSQETVTNLTIPSNISLRFVKDGMITYSGRLNIQSPNISATDRQIFDATGSGEADFARGTNLRSTWFEDLHEMFDQTLDNYVTLIISSGWNAAVDADCQVGNNVGLKWEGPGNRIVINSGFELSNIKNIDAGNYQIFAGSGDLDFLDGTMLNLSWFRRLRSVTNWVESENVSLSVNGGTVSYTQSVDSNISIRVNGGGALTISPGVVLTINGSFEAGNYQTFISTGTVLFASKASRKVNVIWWGADQTGVVDSTTEFTAAVASITSGTVKIPEGTYNLSNLSFKNLDSISFEGERGSILDFKSVASGTAFELTYDVSGGCKNVTVKDLKIRDSRATSLASVLVNIEGGNTGFTPSQTTAYIQMVRVNIPSGGYNNLSGTAFRIRNVSHILFDSVHMTGDVGCQYGLLLDQDVAVNMGVFLFAQSTFCAAETALKIEASQILIDSISFIGCGLYNFTNANAAETIKLDGNTNGLSATSFVDCHIENRHASQTDAILITGVVTTIRFVGNHISCGTGTTYTQYGFHFSGATLSGGSFLDNEFFRCEQAGSNGYAYYFENDVVLDIDQSIAVKRIYRLITGPNILGVETGGNEDDIWNGLDLNPNEVIRKFTSFADDSAISFTPPYSVGFIAVLVNDGPTFSGNVAYRAEAGGTGTAIVGGSANLEVTTGVLNGTTGSDNKLTVSAFTDGKIYIENRAGSTIAISVLFNHRY